MSTATPGPTSTSARPRWLAGAWPDLLIGCGLLYIVLFAISAVVGAERIEAMDLALHAVVVMALLSIPHYGATLVRVYEDRHDRRKYAFFTVWVTLAMVALFAIAIHADVLAKWLNTVYISWSPWHYSGQNYGIALMLLARAGVGIEATTKRYLWWSFVLSFVLTLVAMHTSVGETAYAPVAEGADALAFQRLGVPPLVRDGVLVVGGAAYLLTVILAFRGLRRSAAATRDVLPAAALVLIQALWFTIPVVVRRFGILEELGPFGTDHVEYWFLWIAAGHAAQYLWIVGYYERKRVPGRTRGGFYLRALLAGFSIWTVPALLFAPGVLGNRPYDLGLFVTLAAVVNLHHFIVDGAIWKLRDGPIARVLLRSETGEAPPPGRGRLAPWIWGAGALSLLVGVASFVEARYGFDRALQDARDPAHLEAAVERAESSLARLSWLGRDGPDLRVEFARVLDRAGRSGEARAQVEQALALHPTAAAYTELGNQEARAARWADASRAYAAAVELDPGHAEAWYHLGLVEIRTGDRDRGVDLLWRAHEAAVADPEGSLPATTIQRAIVEHGR